MDHKAALKAAAWAIAAAEGYDIAIAEIQRILSELSDARWHRR